MNPDDLAEELECAFEGLPALYARVKLVKNGVPHDALKWPSPVGFTHIETDGDLYQPVPGGMPAYIVPEYIQCSDELADPDWRILDLVAVTTNGDTYRRTGLAWALGGWSVSVSIIMDEPLRVYRTPFGWLKARRSGLCVIDWRELWFNLGGVAQIVGQDLEHAQKLRKHLTPPVLPTPDILVPRSEKEPAYA